MRYFVESVTTYSTSGKTRKGAILQAVARKFEHTIIADDDALRALVESLDRLVKAVNKSYKGRPLCLTFHRDSGHICVQPVNNFNDNLVYSIAYAPVGATYFASSMRPLIFDSVDNVDHDLAKAFMRSDSAKEGGEL